MRGTRKSRKRTEMARDTTKKESRHLAKDCNKMKIGHPNSTTTPLKEEIMP